jgi:hypothetical protein
MGYEPRVRPLTALSCLWTARSWLRDRVGGADQIGTKPGPYEILALRRLAQARS